MDNSIPNLQEADKPVFARVKILIIVVVLALLLSSGLDGAWPLTHWPMFSSGRPIADPTVRLPEVHAIDASGQMYTLGPEDLRVGAYGTALGLGADAMGRSFSQVDIRGQEAFREYLTRLVMLELPEEHIVQIQVWMRAWHADLVNFTPLYPDAPHDDYEIGQFQVADYANPDVPPAPNLDFLVGDSFRLTAFVLPDGNQVKQCATLYVRTWWQAISAPAENVQITATLADSGGIGRAQDDGPLAAALTRQWTAGQVAHDRRYIAIPCDFPTGNYNLLVGLYRLADRHNLPVTRQDGTAFGSLAYLTTVEVQEKAAQ